VSHPATAQTRADVLWWRTAVIYQIYIRSFADGDGDGIGDLAGIRSRLPYLRDLGADAIWITPFYPSPMADGGYDVADYRDIEPLFGSLADADAMIADAHGLGLRVVIDIVPNHSSDQHRWFQAALAAGPGSPERERYVFRPGRGEHGENSELEHSPASLHRIRLLEQPHHHTALCDGRRERPRGGSHRLTMSNKLSRYRETQGIRCQNSFRDTAGKNEIAP